MIMYIVVPCYNEHEVLPETTKRLLTKLDALIKDGKCSNQSRILYVDDGSKDDTWELIRQYHSSTPLVAGLKLAHNKGHQNALFAGLSEASKFCDCAISMDADLQDDVEVIDLFLDKFMQGYEIVYGVRSERKTDTAFKRTTAQGYYKFMKALGVDLVYNHADCRLMGKRALQALVSHREVNLFLRGMVPSIGYKTAEVYYERSSRFAGESKYPLKKMLHLAWDGITSFSVKPLSLISLVGVILLVASIIGFIVDIIVAICGSVVTISLLIFFMAFFSSLVLIAIGIASSYIGKIYSEVKDRPRYIAEEFLN